MNIIFREETRESFTNLMYSLSYFTLHTIKIEVINFTIDVVHLPDWIDDRGVFVFRAVDGKNHAWNYTNSLEMPLLFAEAKAKEEK